MFNQAIRPEEAHFLADRPVEEWTEEAEAADMDHLRRVARQLWTDLLAAPGSFVVREDGKSLLVYEDELRLNFQHPHKEQLSRDSINIEPVGYDTPEHEFAVCPEARRLVNMRSMATANLRSRDYNKVSAHSPAWFLSR